MEKQKRRSWTTEEVDYLKKESASSTLRAMAEHLHRTPLAVRTKVKDLELTFRDARQDLPGVEVTVWTEDRLGYLRDHASDSTAGEIARALDVSEKQVRRALYDRGIAGRGRGASRPQSAIESTKEKAKARREEKYPIDGPWRCLRCGETKPLSDFNIRETKYEHVCRSCLREAWLFRAYGLTIEQYDEMLTAQGGVCALCAQPETRLRADGEPFALAVDHDHSCCPGKYTCGKCLRGLLCDSCNNLLGKIEERPHMLERIGPYLAPRR